MVVISSRPKMLSDINAVLKVTTFRSVILEAVFQVKYQVFTSHLFKGIGKMPGEYRISL